jgi:inorganic pyrophosphatase
MVPVSAVDPTWDGIQSLEELPPAELQRVEAFFQVYKNLPDPTVQVEVGPWEGVESALALIRAALVAGVPGG